jgi:4'-phosphopantetheinyl transferase
MTETDHSWYLPPANLILTDDEVHVFRVCLNLPASRVQDLLQILAVDELNRAERFHFSKDRQYFIVSRGLLRFILSRYLDSKPEHLRFCYGKHGKPRLVSANGSEKLSFNLSHSDGLALFAVASGRKIGIDVECIRTDFEYDQIAAQFFSPLEYSALKNLPEHMKPEAFFNCWTRKEAYIKARGDGLSHALDQFDVSFVPGEPATLLQTRGDPAGTSRWSLIDLQPEPGYAAAIAVEGQDLNISCWQWPD